MKTKSMGGGSIIAIELDDIDDIRRVSDMAISSFGRDAQILVSDTGIVKLENVTEGDIHDYDIVVCKRTSNGAKEIVRVGVGSFQPFVTAHRVELHFTADDENDPAVWFVHTRGADE